MCYKARKDSYHRLQSSAIMDSWEKSRWTYLRSSANCARVYLMTNCALFICIPPTTIMQCNYARVCAMRQLHVRLNAASACIYRAHGALLCSSCLAASMHPVVRHFCSLSSICMMQGALISTWRLVVVFVLAHSTIDIDSVDSQICGCGYACLDWIRPGHVPTSQYISSQRL